MFAPLLRCAAVAAAVIAAAPLAAQVPPAPGVTAIAIGTFTGTGDPEWVAAAPGIGDLLINDTLALLQPGESRSDCPAVLVEWRRRAEIIKEIEFQQSRFVDPATRVQKGKLIEPTIMVTGHSDATDGQVAYTVEIRSHPDGALVGTVSGSVKDTEIFDHTPAIASELLDQICPLGWTVTGGGARMTVTGFAARVDAPFNVEGAFPGGQANFTYSPTSPGGGTVSYVLAGGGVSGAGEGTYTIERTGDAGILTIRQTTNGCINGIANSCKTNSEVLTLTPVTR